MLFATRRYQITTLTILSVLAFSTFIPSLAYAQPLAQSAEDWQYVNGNSWGWNYSPQTQINKDNVDQLEVKWVFPVGGKSLAPAAIQSMMFNEGANTPPIVKDGIVYITTNFLKTYAVDAKTGQQVWTHDYTIDIDDISRRLPWVVGLLTSHIHSIRYWESGDAILVGGMACDFYGIDAKTGEEKFSVPDLCLNVPGVVYPYTGTINSIANIGTYDEGRQFIFALAGTDGSQWSSAPGRFVVMGIDMDTYQVLWRVFGQPPHNELAKDWALQECDIGFFQDIPCSEVAAQNRAGLEWDWTPAPGQPVHPSAAVTAAWGQPSVDEETGIIYLNTGNQVPWPNVSLTQGPRLYGSTIMAIDMNQGKRVWWLQPFPHDPYDYDCNWSGMLIDHPQLGKVYMKGCKEGILYVMDAATGKPKYKVDIIEEQYPGMRTAHITDPFSYYDLKEWGWPENSRYHGSPPLYIVPSWAHGAFSTDMSYDGEDTFYHYAAMQVQQIVQTGPLYPDQNFHIGNTVGPANVTIVARDIATGEEKWTWFYSLSNQRAHMAVSGGLIFSGFTDGNIKFLDKDTGTLLHEQPVGAPVITGVTIGKDSDGNSKIFVIAGATNLLGLFAAQQYNIGAAVPGTLMAIGLSERAPEVKTTTITTTAISSTTVTSASTTISTVEVEIGLPATVTYAAVAVAVIAIIGAAVLATRRR